MSDTYTPLFIACQNPPCGQRGIPKLAVGITQADVGQVACGECGAHRFVLVEAPPDWETYWPPAEAPESPEPPPPEPPLTPPQEG